MDNPEKFSPNTQNIQQIGEAISDLLSREPADATISAAAEYQLLVAEREIERAMATPNRGNGQLRQNALWRKKSSERLFELSRRADVIVSEVLHRPEEYGLRSLDVEAIRSQQSLQALREALVEQKFGTAQASVMTKYVKEKYEKRGKSGLVIGVDLLGLKVFNTYLTKEGYGNVYGDLALQKVASFLRGALIDGKIKDNPDLHIGKRGDEFYLYLPEDALGFKFTDLKELGKFLAKFEADYQNAIMEDKLKVQLPDGAAKNALFYWRAVVAQDSPIEEAIEKINGAIETEKLQVIDDILEGIVMRTKGGEKEKAALLIRYLIEKRIPPDALLQLVGTTAEIITQDHNYSQRLAAEIESMVNKQDIQALISELLVKSSDRSEDRAKGKLLL